MVADHVGQDRVQQRQHGVNCRVSLADHDDPARIGQARQRLDQRQRIEEDILAAHAAVRLLSEIVISMAVSFMP